MASLLADPDRPKPSLRSIPHRRVRIVAKIRGFTDQESESLKRDFAPWISVRRPNEDSSSEKVRILFGDQSTRNVFEVDDCYEQNEDNDVIFLREVKPMISSVFDCQNVAIVAYGARGSGKTYTIQGTEEKQGLAALAVGEILSMVEDTKNSVAISFYEVFQDHVYDLLDPTQPEVQVLEDGQGKIRLKGLSQGFVKSASEFHKLYFTGCNSCRPVEKTPFEMPRRSHKGLIIHILSNNESSNAKLLGKINFVDLAGYEDAKRNSCEGFNFVESSRNNKSLYALLNVVQALNANEAHVPYRENKLTRMLQDSFGGTNHVLMLNCLNPLFCRDTIYTTSLASRSCQGANRVLSNSTKKSKVSAKTVVLSSLKGKVGTVMASAKKPTSSRACFLEKSRSCLVKGRKLFDEGNHLSSSKQAKSPSDAALVMQSRFQPNISSTIEQSTQEEEKSMLVPFSATVSIIEEKSISDAFLVTAPKNENASLYSENNNSEVATNIESLEDGDNMEKENKSLLMNDCESPPLSERLREVSNNLKSLYFSTPVQMKIPCEATTPSVCTVVSTDIIEPKTPVVEEDLRVKDRWELVKVNSTSTTFSAQSTGLKHSLVQEHLKFLNSASKEELKRLRGIGEKRATYILELREESPEPFKSLDDLKDIGLSEKQIKGLMKNAAAELFS